MNIGKQDERLLHEILSKYKQGIISGLYPGTNITFTPTGCRDKIISSTSSGTEGGIQSIQEGDNITVDNTDPLNPTISATGGGSSALFPNGFEFISTSRDFQAGDAGKLLIINDGVLLSMPETNPFTTSTTFGVLSANIDIASFNLGFEQDYIKQLDAEVTILQAFVGLDVLSIVSSGVSDDKTALRYLYDKVQNVIPLTGTEVGKPVTGDIVNVSSYKISDGANVLVDIKNDGGDGNVVVISADGLSQSNITSGGVTAIEGLFNKLQVTGTPTPSTSVGISSLNDYSSVIDDLDYTQKIYVDNIAGKIIDLGTITFEDVNAAPADGTISFTGIITTPLPAGWYVETILVDKHIFDADITSITFKAGGDDNINIDNTNSKVAFSGLIKNDQKDTVPTLDFTFDTVNPQNLTIGFITIKALIKKFPN